MSCRTESQVKHSTDAHALARALYGDPKLVILAKPNSNLDGAGENALAATLRDLRGKVTIVVLMHRNTHCRPCVELMYGRWSRRAIAFESLLGAR